MRFADARRWLAVAVAISAALRPAFGVGVGGGAATLGEEKMFDIEGSVKTFREGCNQTHYQAWVLAVSRLLRTASS